MDKFAYWTLKVLSFVFLISAVVALVLWTVEDKGSHSNPATPWTVWVSAIISSIFFSAVSWTLSKVMYNYLPDLVEEED